MEVCGTIVNHLKIPIPVHGVSSLMMFLAPVIAMQALHWIFSILFLKDLLYGLSLIMFP